LTGITSEQVLFLIYGKGENGKSTFINMIRDMLGDYGRHTPTETLLTKQYDNSISADLARLRGARMVTAVEANFNRSLDEAKIKALTGGEPTTARELYQNFQEFLPLFKLWLVGNDRPRVRATDYAMWRRLRVIPFGIRIPKDDVDRKLPEKLRAELPGILAWAIAGCLQWQREGLEEPAAVLEAARQWRRDADHVKRFFTEKIALTPNVDTSAATMHNEFLGWCKQNGEAPMSAADLKTQLTEKCDMTHKRTKVGSMWVDVTIRG
jgi:putative DNA primase/helicase